MSVQSLLCTFTITGTNGIHCQLSCNGGPALFAFHTPTAITLPFIDLAATDLTPSNSFELKDASISALQPSSAQGRQAQQFLNLSPQDPTNIQIEQGTSFVNKEGQLTSMHLDGNPSFTAPALSNFLNSIPELQSSQITHTNKLHDAWNQGITDYYAGKMSSARADFSTAKTFNPQFHAATTFLNLIASKSPGNNHTSP